MQTLVHFQAVQPGMQVADKADRSVIRRKVRTHYSHYLLMHAFIARTCECDVLVSSLRYVGSHLPSTILGAADDGAIWRWDEVDPAASSSKPDQAAAPAAGVGAGAGADADADA
jgi:hypothetical protein